jgi:transcription termination factor Rho
MELPEPLEIEPEETRETLTEDSLAKMQRTFGKEFCTSRKIVSGGVSINKLHKISGE